MHPILRRIASIFVIILIALLLLELCLQGLAFVFSLKGHDRDGDAVQAEARKIVCIGDSYTFGVGASRPAETSYPAMLEKVMNTRQDGPWKVVNAGWPGRNSRGATQLLDEQLFSEDPELLVLLIGVNDTWSRPEFLQLPPIEEAREAFDQNGAQGSRKFRFEVRTLRLLKTFRGRNLFRGNVPEENLTASSDSSAVAPLEEDDALAEAESEDIYGGRLAQPIRPVEGIEVFVSPGPGDTPEAEERIRRDWQASSAGWAAHSRGEYKAAERFAFELSEQAEPMRLHLLSTIYGAWGKPEAAQAQLTRALELIDRPDLSEYAAQNIATVFHLLNASEQTIDEMGKLAGRFPKNAIIRQYYTGFLMNHGRQEEAERECLASCRLHRERGNELGVATYAYLQMGQVFAESNPAQAVEGLYYSYALAGNLESLAGSLLNVRKTTPDLDVPFFEEVLDRVPFTDQARTDILEVVDEVVASDLKEAATKVADFVVLRDHYRQIAERCDAFDTRLLLVNYPFFQKDITEAQRDSVAGMENARFFDATEEFAQRLYATGRSWDDFFIADGHCNDDGYALFAEIVHDAIDRWSEE